MVIIILAPGRVAEEEIDGECDPDDNDHHPGHHLQYHPQENNHLDSNIIIALNNMTMTIM